MALGMMNNNSTEWLWPQGDTHFERMGPWQDYQKRNRQAFIEAMWDLHNYRESAPTITMNRIATVIDIGAHVGTWSCDLSPLARQVYAYEPWHHDLLRENAQRQGCGNVTVRPVALSNGRHRDELWVRQDNSGDTGLGLGAELGRTSHEIECHRLDDFEHEGWVQGIKIDVQGHELQVLQGAEQTIRLHGPILCVELNQGNSLVSLWLSNQGYTLRQRQGKDWIFERDDYERL